MQPASAKVTTVVPVYNGERFLEATLRSIAQQKRRPDRVVILDNCSTDATRQVVEGFSAYPCEWRQNEKNIGLTGNLNRALEFATQTEYLHILLADDMIKPEFFETIIPALEPVAGRAIGYSPFEWVDQDGQIIPPFIQADSMVPEIVPLRQFLGAQAELDTILIPAVVLKTACRPSPFQLPLDMPQVGDCLFYALWGTVAERIVKIPRPLCQYRVHTAQTTTTNMLSLQAWVLDEWRIMETVSARIPESRWAAWLRRQRLKCLFSARSHVKVAQMRARRPEYAQQIAAAARSKMALHHWWLGKMAVALRDLYCRLAGVRLREMN